LESGLLTPSIVRLYVEIKGQPADQNLSRIELKEPQSHELSALAFFRIPQDVLPDHARTYLMSFPVGSSAATRLASGGRLLVHISGQQPPEMPVLIHRDNYRSLVNQLVNLASFFSFSLSAVAIWNRRRSFRHLGAAAELSRSGLLSAALLVLCLFLLSPFLFNLFWPDLLQFTLPTLDVLKFATAVIVSGVATFIAVRTYQSTRLIADVWNGNLLTADRLVRRLESGWIAAVAAALVAGALVAGLLLYASAGTSASRTIPAQAIWLSESTR